VIDVRTEREWRAGRIDSALSVPLSRLSERLDGLPAGPLVVYCTSGYRSAIASSLIRRAGIEARDLVGGLAAWESAQLEVVSAE
jgi:rhodanese-related sulfurtransferase